MAKLTQHDLTITQCSDLVNFIYRAIGGEVPEEMTTKQQLIAVWIREQQQLGREVTFSFSKDGQLMKIVLKSN